jgi:hypothetical protein
MVIKRLGVSYSTLQKAPIHIDHPPTIPASFIKLDSNVSAADSYVNVRDELVKRQNHNILMARRCKRNVMHMGSVVLTGFYGYPVGQRLPIDAYNAPPEMFVPLYLSQATKEIQVVMRCCQSDTAVAGDHDPQVAFVLCPHGSTRAVATSDIQSITTAVATTDADCENYTWTVPVPGHTPESAIVMGQMVFDLYMLAYAPRNDTATATGIAISWWGNTYVETSASAGDRQNQILKIGDDYRMVQRTVNNDQHMVDAPWSSAIDMTSQTIDAYTCMQVRFWSISVYELNSTSFVTPAGRF